MRLVRYGDKGHEKPGLLDARGMLRDLSDIVFDIAGDALSAAGLRKIRSLQVDNLPRVKGRPRFGAPVGGTSNFIGVGLNYADHAAETKSEVPDEPVLFNKAVSCISGPNDDIVLPPGSERTDWEVELAVVIGREATRIKQRQAMAHIAGYCICNDVSERRYQRGSGQWVKGKSSPSFGPLGPWLVTREDVPDPQALDLTLHVNAKRMQSGSTSRMIFPVDFLVAYASRFMTLLPGDVITTGTPPGVGMGRNPRVFLKEGDTVRARVSELGEQWQTVVQATR